MNALLRPDFWNRVGIALSCRSPTRLRTELPLEPASCGCRCSRFRCGMTAVLLTGTLNRVMIVELGLSVRACRADGLASAAVFAPFRALIGHKSDTSPFGPRLEARALHLVRDADAVRRARHPALCAARDDRSRHSGPAFIGQKLARRSAS